MLENFFVSYGLIFTCIGSLVIYYLPVFRKFQVPLLVIVSFFIYWSAAGNLIFLLLFCCAVTSQITYQMARSKKASRKPLMIMGIIVNLSLLFFFKYKSLLIPASVFANWFGNDPTWLAVYKIALPVGISFYVFHSISIIVDSYKNPTLIKPTEVSPQAHFFKTSIYLVFFPQVVAGPIAKGKTFYLQIVPKYFADIDWTSALRYIIHGYFLKEVIANNLNQLTAPMDQPQIWALTSSSKLLWMMFGYSAQIFADFAGYSLIAIGLGKLYGYELPINFNYPYLSHSFTNFWQRWHISLSSWLRDYLYIPLGGNRKGRILTYFNLMTVMVLGGLWHGPEWKYATWGIVHGAALAFERLLGLQDKVMQGILSSFIHIFRVVGVFLYVTLAWLFFRLASVNQVISYMTHIFSSHKAPNMFLGGEMMLLYILTGVVFAYHILNSGLLSRLVFPFKHYDAYLSGLMLLLCIISRGQESDFIYFRF